MNGRSGSRRGQAGPAGRDLALDLEVGMTVEGFRWVEWNHRALSDSPLNEAGRFVGHPGDLLGHLYVASDERTPPAPHPYAQLPCYSCDAGAALRAAERAGVFRGEGARLSCSPGGVWRLIVAGSSLALDDENLPHLLARSALVVARARRDQGAS